MNYTEIKSLALGYADRTDTEVIDAMDGFIKVVESRINRALDVRKMAINATITRVEGAELYDLPSDFVGLRDIEISSSEKRTTAHYLNPEQMNEQSNNPDGGTYYTIIANQFQILPKSDSDNLDIVYYQRVPNLNETDSTNWLSEDNPDTYVFGLLVEINSFIKDAEGAALWDNRFKSSVDEIKSDDSSRWSGTPLQIRAE